MQMYLIIFGIAGLVVLLAGIVFKIMLGKIQTLQREKTELLASNASLQAELGRALSRQRIEQDVEKKTAEQREQSGGVEPGGDADPNNPLSVLR